MENLAINSLLPASTDASQTMGKDANAGDGKSFMDALSGLMKNTHGKKDKQEASEAVEPATESAEEISGQADPAAGISVLVSSLEHITPGGSVEESTALAMAGMISAGNAGMQGEMPVDESGSADRRLAGSTDAAINQVMNSRLAVAAQSGLPGQTSENATAIAPDKEVKTQSIHAGMALSESRLANELSPREPQSSEKFSLPTISDSRQAAQDRAAKSSSDVQELRANEQFNQLMQRISGLEDAIADRREFYNESVNINNVRIEQFPDNFVARLFGFPAKPLLTFSADERKDVDVKALFSGGA